MRKPTKRNAAFHEAAHFILFECGGLVAGEADITGSAFGREGWAGTATTWRYPDYLQRPEDWTLMLIFAVRMRRLPGR